MAMEKPRCEFWMRSVTTSGCGMSVRQNFSEISNEPLCLRAPGGFVLGVRADVRENRFAGGQRPHAGGFGAQYRRCGRDSLPVADPRPRGGRALVEFADA